MSKLIVTPAALIDRRDADPGLAQFNSSGVAIGTAGRPSFYPIMPIGPRQVVDQLAMRVIVQAASSVAGVAIYSIAYTAASTFTATLLAHVTGGSGAGGALDCSAQGIKKGTVDTPLTLDFTTTRYVVGVVLSTATTLTAAGVTPGNTSAGMGWFVMTGAAGTPLSAFTDCVSWPASITQANVQSNVSAERAYWAGLYTTYGAQQM